MTSQMRFFWLLLCVMLVPALPGCTYRAKTYELPLADGRIKEILFSTEGFILSPRSTDRETISVGHKDVKGLWNGEVTTEFRFREVDNNDTEDWIVEGHETATYKNGKLHGLRRVYDFNNKLLKEETYEDGLLVSSKLFTNLYDYVYIQEGAESVLNPSYPAIIKHLQSRKPWLIDKLGYYGYPSEFLMDFAAEIEYKLRNIKDQGELDSSFEIYAWIIGSSDPYQGFYGAYSTIVGASGYDTNKINPLRLAVLQRYRNNNKNSSYALLQSSFPRYLLALRTLGANPGDSQFYINQIDSYLNKINTALDTIPANDRLFPSKVDRRLTTALAILDGLNRVAGEVNRTTTTIATDYFNAGNPLLDATRYGFFGQTLPLSIKSTGAGHVTGEGIECGYGATDGYLHDDCTEYYDVASNVTLTASPSSGATFAGWSGDCAGKSLNCSLKISKERLILATFTGGGSPYHLSVRQIGGGTVAASPVGISGGIYCYGPTATCTADFAPGTLVTLTASPNSDAKFVGWAGSCSGTATTCQITMNADKTVAATFKSITPSFPLALFRDGPGDIETSHWALDCGNDCTGIFPVDTSVTLTAQPGTGAKLVKWSGACQGASKTCDITIKGETYVSATFATE